MTDRSARREVRNPLLALNGVQRLRGKPRLVRDDLRQIFKEIAIDARHRAQHAWKTHKAPMAVYWKAVSVYANHLARVLNED